MQRVINDPEYVVEDMLIGFQKAHEGLVKKTSNPRVLLSTFAKQKGRVAVISGGGSGHKPAFIGYLGRNMLDAVAVGEIFSSPAVRAFYDAMRFADAGAGVACLYGNYAGDNMNVAMARELAEEDGIEVRTVIANDDVASAPKAERDRRRGVAGEILMWKVGAAKAALGGNLNGVINAAQKAIDNTRSVGLGLSPCTIPAVGKPNFTIEPGTMEVGIGHHGEPGVRVEPIKPASEMATEMLSMILPDLPFESGCSVVVLVSGLGATPVMEQYILYGEVEKRLAAQGINVHRAYVGNYFTSLEMMGVTLTLMKLDEELTELIDLETDAVSLKQFPGGKKV